jgi:hypothetical protein
VIACESRPEIRFGVRHGRSFDAGDRHILDEDMGRFENQRGGSLGVLSGENQRD